MPVFGQILGIEGTAWNLSAALFDPDLISLASRPYSPAQGGIHPREAAQHHASVMKELIGSVLTEPEKITGIAFSQGPGLGPCLRTVATAARSLALALDVPLVGVNHCVAHVEIGCFATGCKDPIVLYASGANTQVIGYLNGRYRIFGETLDIGIGNALDKFARAKNFPHPGGPHIETQAKSGSYIELPYTVKGMDLAFSGLISAAKDHKAPLPDVCYSLQETAFAMCVEVTERAMSLAGKNEVLLVGGVGANRRLQEMLRIMCEERGAEFFVPEQKYLGDNGAMIAYTGKLMLESGLSLPVESSQVNPSFRSDEVEVTWKHETVSTEQMAHACPRERPEAGCRGNRDLQGRDRGETPGIQTLPRPGTRQAPDRRTDPGRSTPYPHRPERRCANTDHPRIHLRYHRDGAGPGNPPHPGPHRRKSPGGRPDGRKTACRRTHARGSHDKQPDRPRKR